MSEQKAWNNDWPGYFKTREWYQLNLGYRYSLQMFTTDGYVDVINSEFNIIYFKTKFDAKKYLQEHWMQGIVYFDDES